MVVEEHSLRPPGCSGRVEDHGVVGLLGDGIRRIGGRVDGERGQD
jgi:hypothetical protein